MRNRYILLADLLLVACAALGAFALRFDWWFFRTRHDAWPFLIAAVCVKPVVFGFFGMYRRYWRYASTGELMVVLISNAIASIALAALVPVGLELTTIAEFPRSVILIDGLLSVVFTGGIRFSVRVLAESQGRARKTSGQDRPSRRRVLIVGAGDAGTLVARESQRNPQLGFDIIGFLDDDAAKNRKRIVGAQVLGGLDQLEHAVTAYKVDEVVIAMPTAPGAKIRVVADTCRRLRVPSKTVPGMFELLGHRLRVRRRRGLQITDLLKRSPVDSSQADLRYLVDRTVIVTGAGGSIGSELCRQVAMARPRLILLLGHGENSIFEIERELAQAFPGIRTVPVIADIRDARRVRDVFQEHRPSVVFHAAAHKHVPLMESNPDEAITNNVLGTARVVQAAIDVKSDRFVLISSDKAVSPTSVMGASKRLAEEFVRAAALRQERPFVVVRFGNVLGSRGSVVPLFQRQIERGGPITITHPDMQRFFMTIPEAVHLVLQAGGLGQGGEVFVLNMGTLVPVVELARDLVRLSGLEPDEIPFTYTGLRPGEKLVEELWEEDAQVDATRHADVFQVREPDRSQVNELLADIAAAGGAREWAPAETVTRLLEACRRMVGGVAAAQDGARGRG